MDPIKIQAQKKRNKRKNNKMEVGVHEKISFVKPLKKWIRLRTPMKDEKEPMREDYKHPLKIEKKVQEGQNQ